MAHTFKLAFVVSSVLIGLSLVEAVVLGWRARRGGAPFAWYEMGISLVDMAGRRLIERLPISLAAPVFAIAWHYRIYTVPVRGALTLLLLFLGQEFCYYWYHRAAHRVRFFWASHAVHHSPNQLTLSTAYRLGWTGKLTGSGLFFTPLVWFGVQPHVVLAMLSFNLLYQFWVHNTWTPRLGWLEYVFNTPSAHRVHHASNVEYLDANYGGVLVIFDRLFGTYVAERDDVPCRYGLVTPTHSRNPLVVEFEHWASLGRDLLAARTLSAVLGHLFRPPGWRADGGGETTEELRSRAGLLRSQSIAGK
ncbi:sterol desaturase family protein [Paraburkholderia sp. J12]|uniref:sterol desaturase family protein n=1 Tax=Paraburkholderia sp. J12 TaxID=2805432 RepID=UPI002ABD41D8|nr:sterol desaturase family protein [Paraburkholderia sp. J12]